MCGVEIREGRKTYDAEDVLVCVLGIRVMYKCLSKSFSVMMVDVTHLCGFYKGKLLVAVTQIENNHKLHVAYAVVDDEFIQSWT